MKKLFIIIFVMVAITVLLTGDDLRGTKWGMTTDAVKQLEKTKPVIDQPGQVVFNAEYEGEKCLVVYKFEENKLISVAYQFDFKEFLKKYGLEFARMKGKLIEKYKIPDSEEYMFKDAETRLKHAHKPEDWWMPLSMQKMTIMCKWTKLPDQEIVMLLFGKDMITYTFIIGFMKK